MSLYLGDTVIAPNISNAANKSLSNLVGAGTSRGAGWAMPSDTYEDLTLGASGTTYTAPANGWVSLVLKANASLGWVTYICEGVRFVTLSPTSAERFSLCVPVKKMQYTLLIMGIVL
jgi:hypothetical protein